jgi:hypothetical protein
MEKLLAPAVGEVTNGTLRDPIWEMCIDTTEGKPLAVAFAWLFEQIVGKASIVAVIVLDGDHHAWPHTSRMCAWLSSSLWWFC